MSVTKDPSWKQAVDDLLAEEHEPGKIITKEWLVDHLGMPPPDSGTVSEIQGYQLEFLQAFDKFRQTLLREHKIALNSKHGIGYEVVDPNDQADLAIAQGMQRLKRDIRWMARMVRHVDHARLDADGARSTANAQAKVAAIAGMRRKVNRIQASATQQEIEQK